MVEASVRKNADPPTHIIPQSGQAPEVWLCSERCKLMCHMRPSVQEPDPSALEQDTIGDFGSAAVPITRGYAAKAMLCHLDTATGNRSVISLLEKAAS